jgi:hypothetical protein
MVWKVMILRINYLIVMTSDKIVNSDHVLIVATKYGQCAVFGLIHLL